MTRKTFLVLASGLLACSDSQGPNPPADYELGRVSALVDGTLWRSSYAPDSVVAFVDTSTGWLQIIGQDWRRGHEPSTLMILLPSTSAGSVYPLFAGDSGRVSLWAPASGGTYVAQGAPGDSIWIEQLDRGARFVRGSFRFRGVGPSSPRPGLEYTSTVFIEGRFEGFVRLVDTQ